MHRNCAIVQRQHSSSAQADQEKRVRVHGGGRTYFLNFSPTRRSAVPQVCLEGSVAQSNQKSTEKRDSCQTSLKCPLSYLDQNVPSVGREEFGLRHIQAEPARCRLNLVQPRFWGLLPNSRQSGSRPVNNHKRVNRTHMATSPENA